MDTRGFIKTTAADKTSPLRLQNVNSNQQCVTPATSIFYLQSLTETQANVEWNQFLLHCCCLKRRTSVCLFTIHQSETLGHIFCNFSVFNRLTCLTGPADRQHSCWAFRFTAADVTPHVKQAASFGSLFRWTTSDVLVQERQPHWLLEFLLWVSAELLHDFTAVPNKVSGECMSPLGGSGT